MTASPSLKESPQTQPLIMALFLALLFWALATAAYHGAVNPNSGVTGGDFKFFFNAADRLNKGQQLYVYEETGATYVYSPLLALCLRPFAALGHDRALACWAGINIAALAGAILLYARAINLTLKDAALVGLIALIGFRCWATVMTFGLGQANLLLLLAIALLYWADAKDKPLIGALAIASGALIKTWMLGLIVYFILRKQYKAAAATLVFLAAAIVILFTAVGWHELTLFTNLTAAYAGQKMGLMVISQSIPGFAQLHLAENQHVRPFLASPLLKTAFIGVGYLAVGGMLLRIFLMPKNATPLERRFQLGLVTLAMLLTLPYCAQEYYVLALPILWSLLLPRTTLAKPLTLAMAIVSLVLYIAMTRPTPNKPLAPEFTSGIGALRVTSTFYIGVLMFAACSFFLLRIHRKPALLPTSAPAQEPALHSEAASYA